MTHKDLIVWQKAVALATKVYAATAQLPNDDRYGLISQMRRAAVLVPSAIAEGADRCNRTMYLQRLSAARGSLAELETQVQIARALGLIDTAVDNLITEVRRLLTTQMQRVREQRIAWGSRAFG